MNAVIISMLGMNVRVYLLTCYNEFDRHQTDKTGKKNQLLPLMKNIQKVGENCTHKIEDILVNFPTNARIQ